MAAFNPAILKPAGKQDANKLGSGNTARDELTAVIETQLALFAFPKATGQRLYDIEGDQVTFSLRYGGKALKLLDQDTKVAVANDQFVAALEHYRGEVSKGTFDEQLNLYGAASASRKASAAATREAKKATKAS